MLIKSLVLFSLFITTVSAVAQSTDQVLQEMEDDTTLGGDIFSDFNEDLESAHRNALRLLKLVNSPAGDEQETEFQFQKLISYPFHPS